MVARHYLLKLVGVNCIKRALANAARMASFRFTFIMYLFIVCLSICLSVCLLVCFYTTVRIKMSGWSRAFPPKTYGAVLAVHALTFERPLVSLIELNIQVVLLI